MPIYAYRCAACGYEKDVLQKLSDAPLTQCPECGKEAFDKQITAAGFQLKGSGWYVTDFRGGNGAAKSGAAGNASAGASEAAASSTSGGASAPADSAAAPAAPAAPTAAAAGTGSGSTD
jgi:putative FmdB family regulatory protein